MAPNDVAEREVVRFYFSFRSPYAWLAMHRLPEALRGLPVRIESIPVFPPKDFPGDPTALPAKRSYILADVERTARAYGLTVRWPQQIDTDWLRPHAAFLYAEAAGRGADFAAEVFAARFSRGLDVGTDETLAGVATASSLEAAGVLGAADDPEWQQRVFAGMQQGVAEGLFGVPIFVYRDERFWGNDRLDWLVRAIRQHRGEPVSDLCQDLMANPRG
jgi:2-hydroxychromene-2-carboxylate isomerase